MNYNRYWDLHLCSELVSDKARAKGNTFTHRGTEYRYDFLTDMEKQREYRTGMKTEGYDSGWMAALRSRSNARILDTTFGQSELTRSQKSLLQLTPQGGISEQLSRLRYVSSLVCIERLKDGHTYPQLQSLVRWISDKNTINKLRINCHGDGTLNGGFAMGGEISPDEFVSSLVRHGLTVTNKTAQDLTGLAHAARWKRDNEVDKCEKCQRQFAWNIRRHHCRRCGGIFCDQCSRWTIDLAVALAGESNKTVTNVRKARVCEQCYSDGMMALARQDPASASRPVEGNESACGLKQITLALCLGAKSEDDFSPERSPGQQLDLANAGFAAGSLAYRLLHALRDSGLRGIKVTASNQVVTSTDEGIKNKLFVEVPADGLGKVEHVERRFAEYANTFTFPAKIWGWSRILERKADGRNHPGASRDINVYFDGRSLQFGAYKTEPEGAWIYQEFLRIWGLSGWVKKKGVAYYSAPSQAASYQFTWQLVPPPRVTRASIVGGNVPNATAQVRLQSRQSGDDSFKVYKSYGVS